MKKVEKNSKPLDAILRGAMRAQPGPATPECADAESLAAYSDRTMSAAERERLETHFADCARCQLLLADIARADESARNAKSAGEVPWYRRWRFAVPALAAAAAVVVFISLRRPANVEPPNDQLVAMAQHEAPGANLAAKLPPLPPTLPAAAPNAPVSIAATAPSNEIAMNEPKPEAAPRAQAMRASSPRALKGSAEAPGERALIARGSPAANVGAQPPATPESVVAQASSVESVPRAAVMGAAVPQTIARSAAAPGARTMLAEPAAAPNSRSFGSFGAGGGGTVAAAPGGAAVGAAAGAAVGGAVAPSRSDASASAALVTISAPDQSVAWIIGKNGMILRRDADGGTHPQHSGVSTDLVAGAAPSATLCWIVGRSGTIVRTTDGEHWTLIVAPNADNLIAVTASDANDATITTAGGRSFTTTDGGASWHPQ